MEKRGRKRTPVAVLKYGGSWRHKNKTDANILAAEKKAEGLSEKTGASGGSDSEAPGWLSVEGKKEWVYLVERLEPVGLYLNIDRNALGRYCEMMVLWVKAKDAALGLDQVSEIVGSERYTKLQVAGSIMVMEQLGKTLCSMEKDLGLTVNARTTIPIEAPKKPRKQIGGGVGAGLSLADFQRESNG